MHIYNKINRLILLIFFEYKSIFWKTATTNCLCLTKHLIYFEIKAKVFVQKAVHYEEKKTEFIKY